MPLIKVWNHDRSIRKNVKVTDLKDLLNVGRQKLRYDTELKAWLETGGTDIDDENILQDLYHQKNILQVIMISDRMRAWCPIRMFLQELTVKK